MNKNLVRWLKQWIGVQRLNFITILVILSMQSTNAPAVQYSQNFDMDDTSNWTTNDNGLGTNAANFFFDYSTIGIPPAPHSNGTTRGLKLGANLNPASSPTIDLRPALSVSPTGRDFPGDMTLTFDWWHNYIGPLNTGAVGSTMLSTFGLLTSGTTSNYAGASDGVFFAATGDGGSVFDYRVYSVDRPIGYQSEDPLDTDATFQANSLNNTASYYTSNFSGGQSAPTIQKINFPQQTGLTPAGTVSFQWHEVEIKKTGSTISWNIDTVPIATLDTSSFATTTGGTNILFGQSDTNNSTSNDISFPLLQFTLIDNIQVREILAGDFDHNNEVDGGDFLVWQRGGSPNGVNSGDLALWQAQYGSTLPLTTKVNAVPEPSLLHQWLTLVLASVIFRQNQRRL